MHKKFSMTKMCVHHSGRPRRANISTVPLKFLIVSRLFLYRIGIGDISLSSSISKKFLALQKEPRNKTCYRKWCGNSKKLLEYWKNVPAKLTTDKGWWIRKNLHFRSSGWSTGFSCSWEKRNLELNIRDILITWLDDLRINLI